VGGLDRATIEQWIREAAEWECAHAAELGELADVIRKSDARIMDVTRGCGSFDGTLVATLYSHLRREEAHADIYVTPEFMQHCGIEFVAAYCSDQILSELEWLEAQP